MSIDARRFRRAILFRPAIEKLEDRLVPAFLANPSFEAAPDLTGYTVIAGSQQGSVSVDRSGAATDGTAFAALLFFGEVPAGTSDFGPTLRSDLFSAKAGDTLLVDWRATQTGDAPIVRGSLFTSAGVRVGDFFNATLPGSTDGATAALTVAAAGDYYVEFQVGSRDANSDTSIGAELDIDNIRIVTSPAVHLSAAGVGPTVVVFNDDGSVKFNLTPYEKYAGGVSVAVGDLTGDGVDDIVTGAESAEPHVKVFDGATGAELFSFIAYTDFLSGTNVAVGDVLGLGHNQIITGAGAGGGPHVKVFDMTDTGPKEVRSFLVFDQPFVGGIAVAAGQLDSSGHDLLVVGAGSGAGPHVKVFDLAGEAPGERQSAFDFDTPFTGGVYVAAGDGLIVIGAGLGGDSHVEAFHLHDSTPVLSFDAYDNYQGAVRVAVGSHDGAPVIETGSGPGVKSHIKYFSLDESDSAESFFIGDAADTVGTFVAGLSKPSAPKVPAGSPWPARPIRGD